MKTITILLLHFTLPIALLAQNYTYQPLLTAETKDWYEYSCSFGGLAQSTHIRLEGDTIIDQQVYKKLFINDPNLSFGEDPNQLYYACAIREENKQIYRICNSRVGYDTTTIYKIYDFNIKEGDMVDISFSWLFSDAPPIRMRVEKEEMITVNETLRKKWTLAYVDVNFPDEVWVEGIGSSKGLLMAGFAAADASTSLLCVHQNEQHIYSDPDIQCGAAFSECTLTSNNSNAANIATPSTFLHIAPNPIQHQGILTYQLFKSSTIHLKLYDIQGQLIQTIAQNETQTAGTHSLPLPTEALASGIYYCTLFVDNTIATTQKISILK